MNTYGTIDITLPDGQCSLLTPTKNPKMCTIPARYVLTIIGFLSFFSMAAQRLNIGIALVAMINETESSPMNGSSSNECPMDRPKNITQKQEGEFEWDPQLQGLVLAAANYGFIFTQIPGGRLAECLGAKWVFAAGMICSTIFTLLTPLLARWSVAALIVAQVFKGLGQGLLFPCINSLVGKWVPKMERSFHLASIFSGLDIGTFAIMMISGVLCDYRILGGWPSIFYLPGIAGIIVIILWIILIFESPSQHTRISNSEYLYLLENQSMENNNSQKSPIRWRILLLSVPVWALVIGHFGQFWLLSFFAIVHPLYMGNILHYSIKENGLLSSIPFLLKGLFGWLTSFFADWLRKGQFLTANAIRKTANSISAFGSALCILAFCLAGCNRTLNDTFFILAYLLTGFMYLGTIATPVDMSPQYAGSITGLMYGFGTLSGVLVPAVLGALIKSQDTLIQWQKMFYITLGISAGTAVIFLIFGSAKRQNWESKNSEELAHDVRCDNAIVRVTGDENGRLTV